MAAAQIPSPAHCCKSDPLNGALGHFLEDCRAVGSRVTCNPAPVDTDEDWLIRVSGEVSNLLAMAGFTQEGQLGDYTGNIEGGFQSWRKDTVNLIVTSDVGFFDRFVTASLLAARFNLLLKEDRIALFQAVLYGRHAL